MVYCPVALRRQPDDPCRMPPRSPLKAAIRREIGADPARMSTESIRVERLSGSCTRLRGPSRLRAVAEDAREYRPSSAPR